MIKSFKLIRVVLTALTVFSECICDEVRKVFVYYQVVP